MERGGCAVRRRRGKRREVLLFSRFRLLLLPLVSFRGLLVIFSYVGCFVFSLRHKSIPRLSQYAHLCPPFPLLNPSPNPLRPSHFLLVPLHGRHYSRPSPLYPALSSHHLLLRNPPSSAPQGRSPGPPLLPLKTTSPNLPLPNLFNRAIRARVDPRRSSLLVPSGFRTKRFG